MASFEDTQRTTVVEDEEDDLPRKQKVFKEILESLNDSGRSVTLLNYYKTWPKAYSVSEKLLGYCILLIYQKVIPSEIKWDKLFKKPSTSRIIKSIKNVITSNKDSSVEELELKLKLDTIRYLRLAEMFLAEVDSQNITKFSTADIVDSDEEESEEEEAPEV